MEKSRKELQEQQNELISQMAKESIEKINENINEKANQEKIQKEHQNKLKELKKRAQKAIKLFDEMYSHTYDIEELREENNYLRNAANTRFLHLKHEVNEWCEDYIKSIGSMCSLIEKTVSNQSVESPELRKIHENTNEFHQHLKETQNLIIDNMNGIKSTISNNQEKESKKFLRTSCSD